MNKTLLSLTCFVFLIGLNGVGSARGVPLDEPFQMPGWVEGNGTHFEVDDSDYLNITLNSTEPINLVLESMAEMVNIYFNGSLPGTDSTQITLGGFVPLTTYYKYEDDYHNLVPFTTDENGNYIYTQDLFEPHLVFIQPRKSTKSIRDDATGGDCTSIGTWDPSTKTCTLTTDLTETIRIDSNGITLDGNGHKVTRGGSGSGVYLSSRTGVTIRDLTVKNFIYGISLYLSSNNTLTNNTASNNNIGINLDSSGNNTLTNNTASNNNWYGVYLDSSSNNTLTNNTANSNTYNIYITGSSVAHYVQTIDTTNKVDSKPVHYLVGVSNLVIDFPTNVGFVGVVSGINVTVRDLTLTKNGYGVLFVNTTTSSILNVNVSNNYYGIHLYSSSNNDISNNNVLDNRNGIYLYSSSKYNTLANNIANSNNNGGIYLGSSSYNTITNNIANSNNGYGIELYNSSGNALIDNTASNNLYGIYLHSSSSNTITSNNVSNKNYGIRLYNSSNNTLTNNIANSNTHNGIYLHSSSDNAITNNTASYNYIGILLHTSSNNNTLINNTANSNNEIGISFYSSNSNTITNNIANSNNYNGIRLSSSSSSILTDNTAANNNWGIYLHTSSNNTVYHNNIINNINQSYDTGTNSWDNGYPSGGNHWSDWTSPDKNIDGFVDTPYLILGGANQDNYPFVRRNEWIRPPAITIYSPQNKTYPTKSIGLNVSADELIDTWWYSLNSGVNITFIPSTTITAPGGPNYIIVYANDTQGNTNSSAVYFTVHISLLQQLIDVIKGIFSGIFGQ